MDWISLSPADLECALNKPQLEILKAQYLQSPNRDAAVDIIASVTARIRVEIVAGGTGALDADHSRIPPELKECALRLAVESLQLRVPSMEITQAQQKHADIARQTLARVAAGELPVSRPEYPIRTAWRRKGAVCGSSERQATRKTMKGL